MLLNASLALNRTRSNHTGAAPWTPSPPGALNWLCSHHPDFPPIRPRPGQALRILGVVITMVRALYPVAGYRPPTDAWS